MFKNKCIIIIMTIISLGGLINVKSNKDRENSECYILLLSSLSSTICRLCQYLTWL